MFIYAEGYLILKIIQKIKRIPTSIAIFLVFFYQRAISPLLPSCCRFVPTCSQYSIEAFKKYGFLKGVQLTAKRLIKCRPGGPHGYDPLPDLPNTDKIN